MILWQKMRECGRMLFACAIAVCCLCFVAGCSMTGSERVKLQNLEFTVLGEEKIPGELKSIIEEKKKEPFKLTYSDDDHLYIVIGYGQQATGGYSIAVNELYLTEKAVYVNTSLLGPDSNHVAEKKPSYPVIVIKTAYREEPVIFE